MARRINLTSAALAVGLFCSSAASATETITYTYDARGRLIKVVHTGTVNNNNQACYKYDKADNRTNVKVDVGSLPACP
jgi:YD repeat-containing protein